MRALPDHALIGDCHSSALVDRAGSVSWACFPRFDSPSVFGRILDEAQGGSFDVVPHRLRSVARAYLDGTNVLVTTFTCDGGVLEVTDCMPLQAVGPFPGDVRPCASILRRLACTEGRVVVDVSLTPRFEYGRFVPRFRCATPMTGQVVGGADALWVTATRELDLAAEEISGHWWLDEGEQAWVEVAWSPSVEVRLPKDMPDEAALADRLQHTIDFWRHWLSHCAYDGDYREQVLRSALTLKALIYAPSGAVVAAATTSLPEEVGGERNWDYRYTWIRDATLTLTSLVVLGFEEEASAFKAWIERTGAGRPQDVQIMYGICGERMLPEVELDHLDGHRGSRPVRIGNGAVKQLQLDCYGQLLQSAYLFGRLGGELTDDNWAFLAGLADIVVDRWKEPDQGIWEIRDEGRHFVHSKLNCWMALDRAVRIAEARGRGEDAGNWRRERDALAAYLIEEGGADGWFPQAVGHQVADAATLLVPALGLLPTAHPLVQQTIKVLRRDLEVDGLLHRYLSPGGCEGGEGAFLLCSFWLVDCLTHSGRLDEATDLLERLLAAANDVGLYAEEAAPHTGEALGNFPQAFTHMALVTSCAHLSAARRGLLPDDGEPHDYSELALDRLLAVREQLPD